jgi:UDP-N-acetylglucosamine:LPS N-acetylglucosamine transferase
VSRFLLLSASMGAGHDAACTELSTRLHAAGHESVRLDLLRMLPGPTGGGLRRFYHLIIRRAPIVYSGIYAAFFHPGEGPRPGSTPLAALAEPRLLEAVDRSRADAIVSLFHLGAQLTGRARARGRLAVPCATLVTDFAVHRQWLHPGNDLNLCLTEPNARQARRAVGRPSAVYGPLVAERFRPHPPGEALWRTRLAGRGPAVVVSTGAWGAGSGFAQTADILQEAGYRPVVLCGNDVRLRRKLAAAVPGATTLGWVEDMPGLLAASAALLDNAAGQTALQALAVGVPVIGWRPIPGHGAAGVRRMAQLGLTDHATTADELVQLLDERTMSGSAPAQTLSDAQAFSDAQNSSSKAASMRPWARARAEDGGHERERDAAVRGLMEADVVGPLESMLDGGLTLW